MTVSKENNVDRVLKNTFLVGSEGIFQFFSRMIPQGKDGGRLVAVVESLFAFLLMSLLLVVLVPYKILHFIGNIFSRPSVPAKKKSAKLADENKGAVLTFFTSFFSNCIELAMAAASMAVIVLLLLPYGIFVTLAKILRLPEKIIKSIAGSFAPTKHQAS